jgi:branched-chain amino acid transport system permease protein
MSKVSRSSLRTYVAENKMFVALIALIAVLPFVVPFTALATTILIFSMLALSVILLLGYMGYFTFGVAMFFALGAYTMALLNIHLAFPLLPGIAVTVAFVGVVALAVGYVCFQRSGIYFAILTLALNQLFFTIFYQLRDLTGGPSGLGGINRPDLFGVVSLGSDLVYYYFTAAVFLIAFALTRHVINSTFGKVMQAIRDSETRVDVIGYDPILFKYVAFIYSAALAALGGTLFAMLRRFVSVESASWEISADAIIIALVGGAGTIYGAPIGAIIYLTTEEMLSEMTRHWRLPIGILVVLLVLYRPDGFYPIIDEQVDRLRERFDR